MRVPASVRPLAWALGLGALFLALRCVDLGGLPSPNGDEGNWVAYGYNLSRGWPVSLPPTARFVSLAFAWAIAGAYTLAGPSFAAARAVLVVGLGAGLALSVVALRAMRLGRVALGLTAAVAVHPWAVAWSRTATVPYAWSLGLSLAALAWSAWALESGSGLALFVAVQLVFLGFHASPLSLIAALAVAFGVRSARAPWHRRGAFWVSALCGLAHVAPVWIAALGVARAGHARQAQFFNNLGARLAVFLRTLLGGLWGEPTLRHMTGLGLSRWLDVALCGVATLFTLGALWRAARDGTTRSLRTLASMGLGWFALALVFLPILLAPARPWNLPAIDTDRYLWVMVVPAVLAIALTFEPISKSSRERLWRLGACAALAWLGLGATARWFWYFYQDGGPDRGFYTLAGGGADRGWRGARGGGVLPERLADAIDAARGAAPAVQVVIADYSFNTLRWVGLRRRGWSVCEVTKYPLSPRPGVPHAFVLWHPTMFVSGYQPAEVAAANAQLWALMRSPVFRAQRRAATYAQPNGAALIEVWLADRAH